MTALALKRRVAAAPSRSVTEPAASRSPSSDDGRLDVVAGSFSPGNVFVVLGEGNGRFGAAQSFRNGSGAAVLGVAVGDVTSDGVPDVVSNAFATLSVLPRQPHRSRRVFVLRTVGGQLGPPTYDGGPSIGLAVADLNADARPDGATIGSTALELFTSKVGGALVGAGTLPAGPDAVGVAAAALGGPGRVDLIELDSGNPEQLVHYHDAATP